MSPPAAPKRPGRRALQRMETERLIRATALELFLEHGFEGTTTKQIADAAGVAHGTVFLVAATKEALLVKVLEERLREVVAGRARSLPPRGIAAQLAHVFDGLFDFYARAPQLSRAFLKSIVFFGEPVARAVYDEHVARFQAYLASIFEAAIGRGELAPDARSEVAASNVLGLYLLHVVAFLNEAEPDRRALGARFRAGLDALLRGLRPPRRAPRPRARPRSPRA
jgi:AcrR family transcriptional regulator